MARQFSAKLPSLAALLLFSASSVVGQRIVSVESAVHYPVSQPEPRALKSDLPSRGAGLADPVVRSLGAFDRLQHEVPNAYGQIPIGISPPVGTGNGVAGQWDHLPDGRRVWRIVLRSPDAVAVCVHFSGFNVGRGEVWAYGADETVEGAFTGAGEFGDGYFWTGSIAGDRVTVEYIPAPGEVEEWIPFRIESVSHIWSWPAGTTGRGVVGFATAKREVAPCHLDFKCAPEWATSGAAVAAFIVEKPSSGLVSCFGSLLGGSSNYGSAKPQASPRQSAN